MSRSSRLIPLLISCLLAAVLTTHLQAAAPTLDAFYPAGIQVGKTLQVDAVGKTDPWPSQVYCSNPHVVFKADAKKKGSYSVTASKEAKTGPCFVRLHNKDGSSKAMIFMVGNLSESMEAVDKKGNENNDSNTTAQAVKILPTTLNGRLIKSEDIDIYRVSLKKGQTLIANLDAYGLRMSMDPYLHLYDPDGTLLILGNDNGFNIDPRMIHKVQRDGDYTIAVMAYAHPPGSDIRFTGKKSAVYRLTLTTGPWLSYTLPLAVKNTGNTALKLFGHNLPGGKDHLPFTFTNSDTKANNAVIRPLNFPNTLSIPITHSTPSLLVKGSEIQAPAAATGQLDKAGEIDSIKLLGKKGQKLDIRVSSQSFGFPLDPVLILQNDKNKELKRADDTSVKTNRDAKIIWTVPADGTYNLLISDLFRKGGKLYHYLLNVTEAAPSFTATFDKSSYFVEAGKSVDVKIKIVRINGHKTPLILEAKNLPTGVSIIPPKDIPNKNTDITVKIKAEANAANANLALLFNLKEKTGKTPIKQSVSFTFRPTIPGGPYLLNEFDSIWLTVKGKAKPKVKTPAPKKTKAKAPAPKKAPAKPAPKPKTVAKPKAKTPAKPAAKPKAKTPAKTKPKPKAAPAKTPPPKKAAAKLETKPKVPPAKAVPKPAAKADSAKKK